MFKNIDLKNRSGKIGGRGKYFTRVGDALLDPFPEISYWTG